MMSLEQNEQMRTEIWDEIYKSGPQSIDRLAQQFDMTAEMLASLVDHVWFTTDESLVTIATNDD